MKSMYKLIKNYQLLSGGATERVENTLTPEQQAKLDKILND
jgi:Spy/CpxP family protein refolding chaperone